MQDLQEAIKKIQGETELGLTNKGFMPCPFHSEKNPSARLWFNPRHEQVEFHCFGCGKSYKFETFYKMVTDKDYKEKELSKKITYIDLDNLAARSNAYFLTLLEEDYTNRNHAEAKGFVKKASDYLESRGFTTEDIRKYQIGFIMRADAERLEGIRDNGWTQDKDRPCFLIHPVRNEKGTVVTMQFEDFTNRGKRNDTKLNLAGKPLPLWFSEIPDKDSKESSEWVVTEGIYDAMSFDKIGQQSIALLGQPSSMQIESLKEFKPRLILAFDNDDSSKEMKRKLARELYPFTYLREIAYPEGIKDANELLQKKGKEGIIDVFFRGEKVDLFPPLIDTIDEIIENYKRLTEQAIKIPKEFGFLNEYLPNGLVPGLYALAGAPEAGKTTILNQLSDALAKEKIPTVYFLTEEPQYRLLQRIVKKEGVLLIKDLKSKASDALRYRRIIEMRIDYTAEKLMDIIQGINLRLEKEDTPSFVFIVDSLQALRLSKENERQDIRAESILKTELLAHISRDLSIPVIFTSFMPRVKYNTKEGKIPDVGIFKESGDIEYLIDVGMCLWREEEDKQSNQDIIKLTFVKNRFGRSGAKATGELEFIRDKCKFIPKSSN